jgi:hypothetical protein
MYYILNEFQLCRCSNLKGRTLAWDKQYEKPKRTKEVVKRTPYYGDSYLALMDLYWWTSRDDKEL